MRLLELFGRYDASEGQQVIALGLGAAILRAAALLVIVEYTTGTLHSINTGLLGLVSVGGILGSYGLYRYVTRRLLHLIESTEAKLREEIAAALRGAPLRVIEELGPLKQRAFTDLVTLTSVTPSVVTTIQNLSLVAALTVCVGVVSLKALSMWLLCLGLIALRVWRRSRDQVAAKGTSGAAVVDAGGASYQAHVEDLLDGFKQLKLDTEAERGVTEDLYQALDRTAVVRLRRELINAQTLAVGVALFAINRGVIVFAPASTVGLGGNTGYTILMLLSLAFGPLIGLLANLGAWSRAEGAADGALTMLGALRAQAHEREAPIRECEHQLIELQDLRFSYGGVDGGFTVGPVNLSLRPGELVLVTGGNGCGKSTMMKMLLGLYTADTGTIMWNGAAVTPATLPLYRNLFSSVVSAQYLFSELYGLREENGKEAVDALLRRFGLAEIVAYDGERFASLDLSSGQKMRLAMVVALLEDRPICVFDEWTANQDPDMTRFYYGTLLPELVAAGKCVVAVSHDDRFFASADILVELDQGLVRSVVRRPSSERS